MPFDYDRALYRQRHKVENLFANLKDWRRIATRYDRCAHTFFSAIRIAAAVIFGLGAMGPSLAINPMLLYGLSDTFGAFSSPVHYYGDAKLRDVFFQVARNIADNRDFVLGEGCHSIKGYFFLVLRSVAMCSKHPGFREEQEWRIMHTQGLDDQGSLTLGVEYVNGVPRPVFKIPLKDEANGGLTGISVSQLIEGVIIGPTQFSVAVWDALAMEPEKAGVPDAGGKIVYSAIPLRTGCPATGFPATALIW